MSEPYGTYANVLFFSLVLPKRSGRGSSQRKVFQTLPWKQLWQTPSGAAHFTCPQTCGHGRSKPKAKSPKGKAERSTWKNFQPCLCTGQVLDFGPVHVRFGQNIRQPSIWAPRQVFGFLSWAVLRSPAKRLTFSGVNKTPPKHQKAKKLRNRTAGKHELSTSF